jgi:hypothetical protein
MIKVFAPEGALKEKLPLASVVPPVDVPFTMTETPPMGDPSFESVTLPETVFVWANETWDAMSITIGKITRSSRFTFINSGFLV